MTESASACTTRYGAGWWTAENPSLAERVDELALSDDEISAPVVGAFIDEHSLEKLDVANTHQVKAPFFQQALELHAELEEKGQGYLERSRVRAALATYLRHTVYPATRDREYLHLATLLEDARPWGVWGVDTLDERLVVDWAQRAGLAKLCPDDARSVAKRTEARYVPRLAELQAEGCEVRFAVFTIPNAPRWHLGAACDSIFERYKNEILYARVDGKRARSIDDRKRVFASLKGAVATIEAPLSRHGDWNVHLNVLMVFDARPDYSALREAWGANVEFRDVPAGAGEAALRELVKYPLKAVSLKSHEQAAAGRRAPPVIEWPAEAFAEWWRAHKGFRRTRNWGCLYHNHLPEVRERTPASIEWLGKVKVSPARFEATVPMFDTRDLEARQRGLDLILGTKFAAADPETGIFSRGPPN